MVLQNILKEKRAQVEEEEYYELSFDKKPEIFSKDADITQYLEGDCNHIKSKKYAGHNSPWREKNESPFNILED